MTSLFKILFYFSVHFSIGTDSNSMPFVGYCNTLNKTSFYEYYRGDEHVDRAYYVDVLTVNSDAKVTFGLFSPWDIKCPNGVCEKGYKEAGYDIHVFKNCIDPAIKFGDSPLNAKSLIIEQKPNESNQYILYLSSRNKGENTCTAVLNLVSTKFSTAVLQLYRGTKIF